MADTTVDATRRLNVKKQTLDDAYAAPANFLEIDVINPITHGLGKKRYTDYEVRMRVSPRLPSHLLLGTRWLTILSFARRFLLYINCLLSRSLSLPSSS